MNRSLSHGFTTGDRSIRGSVLIIVMWICLGLVALALYFANSMSSELRAADNRAVEIASRQAVLAGARYAAYILGQYATAGAIPQSPITVTNGQTPDYKAEQLPVGDAFFWIIGRDPNQLPTTTPVFGLVDEASKLNLNTARSPMLQALPNMTPDLADAIVSWRSSNSDGSMDNNYAQMDPPRAKKGGLFESVDELRLVYGMTLDILLGEDTNRNGTLDTNEDDGDNSAPHDNQDGQINPGVLEYVTAWSLQPNTQSNGGPKINIANLTTPQSQQALNTYLQGKLSQQRATAIVAAVAGRTLGSLAEFYATSRMTATEFQQVHTDLTVSTGNVVRGLINVNTASETVLACLPGITPDKAASIVAYRLAHPDVLTSLAWITDVLDAATVSAVGPYLTDQSFQFSADIAAVGRDGRGYCRERFIFDLRSGTPRIIYRQDLTPYGWALGSQVRQTLKAAKENS